MSLLRTGSLPCSMAVAALCSVSLHAPAVLAVEQMFIPPPPQFVRGDANGDGVISQADVVALLRVFLNDRDPPCADAGDIDDSGVIDIADLILLVGFMYFDGRFPAAPFPRAGVDPTDDRLSCMSGGGGVLEGEDPILPPEIDEGQVIDFLEFAGRSMRGFPGETGIRVPILLSSTVDLDGFTIAVRTDPRKVWLDKIDIPTTFPGGLRAEFSPMFTDRISEGYLARSVFLDYMLPVEGKRIPRGMDSLVGYLVFGISSEVRQNEELIIAFSDIPSRDDVRPAPMNEICSGSISLRPSVDPKGLSVAVVPERSLFIRGDLTRDYLLTLSDVILVLRYLFMGAEVSCPDPADVDDSGRVELSDAIVLAEYLFGRGRRPAAPFPNPGKDPTQDALGDCR